MKLVKLSVATAIACMLVTSANADDNQAKRVLNDNMTEVYNVLPSSVENLSDAFTKGMFYGRLRANAFNWDWKTANNYNPATGKGNSDNSALGLGGSMIYKTAPFYGISATAGLYYSNSPFSSIRGTNANVGDVKAGKDTFSRDAVKNNGDWSMTTLAQAYIQYDISKTTFKFGRQIFESVLTKSNDTKMIPNTFEGFVAETKLIPDTKVRGAYFYTQKLRDHTEFHDVLTFKDGSGDSWANNDDAGVHKGLSYANFVAHHADPNHKLIVVDASNKSIKNLKANLTYTAVPDVVSSLIGELNYKIALPNGYTLTPGFRYMQQYDNGGGNIGGASLDGSLANKTGAQSGYKNASSLDGSLAMGRIVLKKGALKLQVAYSAVGNDGDIVAPWRGFPTGGYTRAMGQYNWRANTKSTDLEAKYDFGKANIIPGFSTLVRYVIQNFDESKQAAGMQADSNVLQVDLRKKLTKTLDIKLRTAFVSAQDRVSGGNKDTYNEYRLELNYLF